MKKQEKKFVLAALVLLALAGCKNDTVPEPTRYMVKFETAHGTAPADITVVSGTKLTAEQLKGLADTADYIFEGWYDGETKAEGGTYTVTKDVTLEAKWKPRDQVQINFKVSGNTVELSSEPAEATIHYTTDGTEPKESWDEYGEPIEISSKTTIKAYAEKLGELKESDVVEKTYLVVTFNTDGGSTVASQTVESGQKAEEPPEPELEGSWFLGWYSDEGLAKKFDFNTPITTATTVYAKWRANPGTVVRNGLTIGDVTLKKTSEVQVLSEAVNLSSLYNAASNSQIFVENREGSIQPFVMGQYEVTQQLYEAVMGSNPSYCTSDVATGETQELRPVENVSWYDAVVFCNKLSELMELEPVYGKGGQTDTSKWGAVPTFKNDEWDKIECNWNANGYRLPTEAEWELAARGGNAEVAAWQYTYAGSSSIDDVAWYNDSKTHQVGTKAANGLNLHDMSGNVFEWCWDWHDSIEVTPLYFRVGRGGSWKNDASYCTVSYRGGDEPSHPSYFLGVRLVRSAN